MLSVLQMSRIRLTSLSINYDLFMYQFKIVHYYYLIPLADAAVADAAVVAVEHFLCEWTGC